MSHVVDVFLTVDTEISSPFGPGWRERALADEILRDVDGATRSGDFGVQFQMNRLNAYGLRATFFVESLFASVVGLTPLRRIVDRIRDSGHDVQLHIHPEWLSRMATPIVEGRRRPNMQQFSLDEQRRLVAAALDNLRQCGVGDVRAFRAGNYGANLDTLRALHSLGIEYDSSYNLPYLDGECGLGAAGRLTQPAVVEGVVEFPIACFEDWPGHYRPVQFGACSSAELEGALNEAWSRRWQSFVIVSHSFELVRRTGRVEGNKSSSAIVVKRFERFCEFVAAHPDRFRTRTFSELGRGDVRSAVSGEPLRSNVLRTAWRYMEQIASRVA